MPKPEKASTGIPGLDEILSGGLPRNRICLVEGPAGSGKTTLGLQFLLAGVAAGESALYVALTETREEIEEVARSHGWDLGPIRILEVAPTGELPADEDNTLFLPSEVELGETTRTILREMEETGPARTVIDSLSEIRLLSQTSLRYRRQILAFKQFFAGRKVTAMLIDDLNAGSGDLHLESIAHGVLRLEQLTPNYGAERRRVAIQKLRGVKYRGGFHDMRIRTGGVAVFPRLPTTNHLEAVPMTSVSSGIPEIDKLAGGGIDSGTTVLIMGPAGGGKSAIAAQYAAASASRGELAAIFLLEEGIPTLLARTGALGIPLARHIESGGVRVVSVNPADLTPGEFSHDVREAVENHGARMVVIDSVNGLFNALPGEGALPLQLNELFAFLRRRNVTVILTLAQQGFVGVVTSPVDVSYLADTVFLLRFFEANGEIRKAISMPKKRSGWHEGTIREFAMGEGGLRLGRPITDFRGVLTGMPIYTKDDGRELLGERP